MPAPRLPRRRFLKDGDPLPAFDADGHGTQAAPDGEFHYPPEAFTDGVLNGRLIPCLSVSQQRTFRSGYKLRAEDRHDLQQLDNIEPR